jgi:DNA modification methylase
MKTINQYQGRRFTFYNGDSCEILKCLPDESIHFSIFSPPFMDLYTYSDSDRDIGNCKTAEEFDIHMSFIINELFRVLKPGRIVCVHCMIMPSMKFKDGFIGAKDFPGELIKDFEQGGFIYHSEICIWKNPVTAMQRTKALGLLHKQIKKDACMCRQGFPDKILVFRKPGENPEPVTNTNETFPVELWQEYASPVWMDINQSNTLQARSARDNKDEKHICPLQLDVIERCIKLWTNENDIVLTPFGGIGSEVYQALKMNRRGIGIELKPTYYEQAVKNCVNAETLKQQSLFEELF